MKSIKNLYILLFFLGQLLFFTDIIIAQDAAIDRASLSPSQRDFMLLMETINSQPPSQRDYSACIDLMEAFCLKYPVTSSARAVLHNAKIWLDNKLISEREYQRINKIMKNADPQFDEMQKIKKELEIAREKHDISSLKSILVKLESIIEKYPDTQSAYNAMTAVPSIYFEIGDYNKHQEWTKRFIDKYPKEKTDQSGNDHKIFSLQLQDANQTGNRIDVDSGIEKYKKIITDYENNPQYALLAISDMFSLALAKKRPDIVISMGENVLNKYIRYKDDDTYILIKAYIGDAYIQKKEYDKAKNIFQEIKTNYPNNQRVISASIMIKYIEELKANVRGERRIYSKDELNYSNENNVDKNTDKNTKDKNEIPILKIISIITGLIILILVIYFSFRTKRLKN
jgi:tetratricopeptide (TPR) repeat protein